VSGDILRSWSDHVHDRAAMRRTITIALVVGTVLTLINQLDRILADDVTSAVGFKIAANYIVPWIVSSIGYISARRARSKPAR
jgi:hypothetical protein